MTVSGGPEHTEPTITIPAAPAHRWAAKNRQLPPHVDLTTEARELLAVIEAATPPPPDIEWRAGLLLQRRDAEGNGRGPVYMCRFLPGQLVNLETGADYVVPYREAATAPQWWVPGPAWRVVQGRPIVEFTDPAR